MMDPSTTRTPFGIDITGVRDGMRATLRFGMDELSPFERKEDGIKTLTLSLYLDTDNPGGFGESQAMLGVVNVSDCQTLGEIINWAIEDARVNNAVGDSPRSTHITGNVLMTPDEVRALVRSEGYLYQSILARKY